MVSALIVPSRSSNACSPWSAQRWSLRRNAACSRVNQPPVAPCEAAGEEERHHWNCETVPERVGKGHTDSFFYLSTLKCMHRRFKLKKSHLEQTEPPGAEFVLALAVLEREKLYELVDEHWIHEMVKDDLLSLWKYKINFQYCCQYSASPHMLCIFIFCTNLCHLLSFQVLFGLLLWRCIHQQLSRDQTWGDSK